MNYTAFFILFLFSLSSKADLNIPVGNDNRFPNSYALSSWTNDQDITDHLDVVNYPSKVVSCADTSLFPTHPQEDTKSYHIVMWNPYLHFKLKGSDYPCLIDNSHAVPNGQMCLRADTAHYMVLSDIYEDSCGNMYRGFFEVTFLGQDDNMGTLVAKGRTIYPDPHAEFSGQFINGGTYKVSPQDFVKLGPVFVGDAEKVRTLKQNALRTHVYDSATHLFREK